MLPTTVAARIAAFAQQLTVYESPQAYDAAQAAQGLPFGSQSFIPSGLVSPSGEPGLIAPESHALIAGQVIEADAETRSTAQPFWWALRHRRWHIQRGDQSFAAVEPGPHRLAIAGWFWLSGRLRRAWRHASAGWPS